MGTGFSSAQVGSARMHPPPGRGVSHRRARTISWLCRVAFLCWLLANVMLSMPVLVYGGHMLLATGFFQLLALAFFSTTISSSPPCPLCLGPAVLLIHPGPAFWITLATGEACSQKILGTLGLQGKSQDLYNGAFC